ncbi:MAG: 23S rRNA (guanosine(2251)-2'-O)-methyltransferase RlmB [Lutibacter sp.]
MENSNTLIFGIRAVIEALHAQKSISKIYLLKNLNSPLFYELKELIKQQQISISFVPQEKLDKLSKYNNHQGVVAHISPVGFQKIDTLINNTKIKTTSPLFLILDGISDVRNFGAIIRSAECTGVDGIIIPNNGNAPINAETIKTSAGAAFNVPMAQVSHIKDAIFYFQGEGIQIVAATEKTENLIYDIDFTKPTAIIMGAEDKGIHPSVLKMVDAKAKLPLLGKIESLNVSVACGAFLYETVRQRLK